VEAGPLQRDVDELLVREAGAQSASSAAAAHCSSEVVRLGMREQGDGAGTGREEMRRGQGRVGRTRKATRTRAGTFPFPSKKIRADAPVTLAFVT